ncbi:MAG: leucyl aminopeptidase [Bacteroidetes Order II. Incertae sedis bacterium]|nr:leucyl aminopeptidase [Bacteroidetes Order II. bacterium]
MKVSVSTIGISELDVDLLLVPVTGEDLDEGLSTLVDAFGSVIEKARADMKSDGNSSVIYPDSGAAKRIVLLGVGDADSVTAERLRLAASDGASSASTVRAETVGISVPSLELDGDESSQALVEGFILGSYRFDKYRTVEPEVDGTQRLVIQTDDQDKQVRRGADRGRIVAEGVCSARDLVNLSPDEKTPVLFAKAIEKSARKTGYEVSVWDKELIEEEGMGGLLAVNRGREEPPTFSVLEWQPENARNSRPIILVGKGVVYDTGGLSLKPTKGSMDSMKCDMAGAAAVVGAMEAIAKLDLPLYVIGLIPATDNRPGKNAYVPGDVVKMHSGKTVEVLNTDAEGRMILADALSYASTFYPEIVVELATLTGAAVVALGDIVAAVMTNDEKGVDERLAGIVKAGSASGDRVHPLPMFDEYNEQLKSTVADLKNVGGRGAGSITAAKFLEHFVDYPWIHVDIAGPAFLDAARGYNKAGGSGFGVRLLTRYLQQIAEQKR